ncbi:MAG: hypothetical protein ACK41D_05120 [Rubricoccaceae bacterium]
MTRSLLALALVASLGLTACQSDTVQVDSTGTVVDTTVANNQVVETGDPSDMSMDNEPADNTVTPEGTASTIDGGLTAITVDAAVRNINGWLNRLDGADFPQASDIRSGLRDLRGELQNDVIDGARVASLLADLGRWTSEAAASAAPDAQSGLQSLGTSLSNAANSLRGTQPAM